jgi:hypothetical protein
VGLGREGSSGQDSAQLPRASRQNGAKSLAPVYTGPVGEANMTWQVCYDGVWCPVDVRAGMLG